MATRAMRAMRARILGVVALVVAGVAPTAAHAATFDCARFGSPAVAGRVENTRLVEISGLAASRSTPGAFWTHNDSGGAAEVFAVGADGSDLGSYRLGVDARDWEDMAIGPVPGRAVPHLFVGDIGDNAAGRNHVVLLRVPEPSASAGAQGTRLSGVERFGLQYPDGAEDAEALLVDPVSGDVVIITKSPTGNSRVLSVAAAQLRAGGIVPMVDHGIVRFRASNTSGLGANVVTSADISPDGTLILVRTYGAVFAFARAEGDSIAEALRGAPCEAPASDEPQGEAIAIAADGTRYVTISEGGRQPLHVVPIGAAAPVGDTTTTSSATTAVTSAPDDDGGEVRLPLIAAAVLAVAVVAVVAVRLKHVGTDRGRRA